MYAIDFYLGSEIGLWFIHNEKFLDSDRFFTKDEQIMKVIERRNKIRGLGEKPLRAMSVHWPDKFDINTIEKYEYFMNIHPGYLPMVSAKNSSVLDLILLKGELKQKLICRHENYLLKLPYFFLIFEGWMCRLPLVLNIIQN